MKVKAVARLDFIHELSVESFSHDLSLYGAKAKTVPVYGDFASLVSAKLNEIYSKDAEHEEDMVESLGRDLGDPNDPTYDYQLGRKDVITNIDNHQVTIKDTHLAIEHLNHGVEGIGLYDIAYQLAGVCKGVEDTVVMTVNYSNVPDYVLEKAEALINEGKHVCLVIVLPKDVELSEIQFESSKLYEIMEKTDHVSVFATYILK